MLHHNLNSRLGRGSLSHSGTYAWQLAIAGASSDLLCKLSNEAGTPVGTVGLILGLRRYRRRSQWCRSGLN
jgi:hypothetical protein